MGGNRERGTPHPTIPSGLTMGDKRSLYQFWDLVVWSGQLWRVMGTSPNGLYIRSPGWEHGWGGGVGMGMVAL